MPAQSSRSRCASFAVESPEPTPHLLALAPRDLRRVRGGLVPWTHDEHQGGIDLAFFVFPFVAGFGVVARTRLAPWLPRALAFTLVALGELFSAVGLWQAHARTIFFARDLEVANAYTTWFRVTSLFKDPSLYGRYLVVPIAILLVILLFRRGRTYDWAVIAALVAFLFAGLYFSYSQSSFVALFVVTFALAASRDRAPAPDHPRVLCARCRARGRRLCRRGDSGEVREGGHERPLTTRRDHARRLQSQPRGRRRGRRPAARER